MSYQTKRLDHLGIVSGLCDRIELVQNIDQFFPNQERHLSVGEAVKAMILNALGFSSRALYLTPEFFANKPLELLFGRDVRAEEFNDSSLGRAMDLLFEKDITTLFAHVSSRALACFGFEHHFFHLDTTSLSFHGEYKQVEQEPTEINICRGYSKDKRPELKQAVLSMICAHQSTLPVWIEALDGNSSDKKTFSETIKAFTSQLEESESPCFIMDSAFYSAENLSELSNIFWLTRVPETLKQAKEVVRNTEDSEFQETDREDYQIVEIKKNYANVEQRWFLVKSEKAMNRELKSFEKRFEKTTKQTRKEFKKLKGQEFHCLEDAELALSKAEKKWKYYNAEHLEFEWEARYEGKGRPKKDAVPKSVIWKIVGELELKSEEIEKEKSCLGRFILASNMEVSSLSPEDALTNYKAQGSSIERGFRFLKDPMFFADAVYLQKPSRIMVLLMIMTLSLLVYSLAERELRKQLKENDETLPDQKGKPTQNLTLRRVFQMFEGIDVLILPESEEKKWLVLNVNEQHLKICMFLGKDVQKYYESS